jgi:4-hydroxybenzoate polyprenyltransferase
MTEPETVSHPPPPDAPLPDADRDNWVDRHAPKDWRPWLKLGRFDRPAGTWLLMLPAWQGVALAAAMQGHGPDLVLLAKMALGALAMRAAGCAYNDIVDRDIDRQVARTAARPVASGAISVRGAFGFIGVCCAVGLAVLLSLTPAAIGLGVASLALVAAYPFMKRLTWWPQAWLGLTFNWGALLGFAAVAGTVGLPAALLYSGGLFWTLGYDTIYALQDMEDDALVGVRSSARRLGSFVRPGVAVFYAAAFILAMAAGMTAGLTNLFGVVALAYGWHLASQARRLQPEDGTGALKLFRSNRDAGLILFAALVGGAWNG